MLDDAAWTPEEAEALRVAVGRFVRAGRRHDVLPAAQATTLGWLDRDGPLSITELAQRGRVRHQSMRETVQLLAEAGALSRERSPADARRIVCSITVAGRHVLDRDRDARTAWILDALDRRLTPRQRVGAKQIAGLLERLAAGGDADADPEAPGSAGASSGVSA